MPNTRNKNRNRRNKNRNKNNNQNKKQNKSNVQKVQDENLHGTISNAVDIVVPAESELAQCFSNNDAKLMSKSETEAEAIENINSRYAIKKTYQECRSNEIITDNRTSNATSIPSNDTVFHGTSSHIEQQSCDADLITETKEDIRQEENVEDEDNEEIDNLKSACVSIFTDMGAKDSKSGRDTQSETADIERCPVNLSNNEKIIETITSNTPPLGKVIVHRIVQETGEGEEEVNRNNPAKCDNELQQKNAKVIIHRVVLEKPNKIGKQEFKENYRVESPADIGIGEKLEKYLDRKEIQIQEISDESSSEYNDNPPLISEAESETETLCGNEEMTGIISIQTEPLTAIDDDTNDEDDGDTDEDEEEIKSSSSDENNHDARQRRVQKRVALETHFLPQLLSPRYLDSIIEENSDMSDARSDCSDNPLMRSTAPSDKLVECSTQSVSDTKTTTTKRANAIFPKSNLDFSKRHKHGALPKASTVQGVIREEPVAMVVETKLVEQMPIEEHCSKLSSMHTPESEAAEVVYINSASSSISDLMELDIEESAENYSQQAREIINLDTDVREIISNQLKEITKSRENAPVNKTSKSSAMATTSLDVEMLKFNNNSNENAAEYSQSMLSIDTNQLSQLSNILSSGSSVITEATKTTNTVSNLGTEKRSKDLQSFVVHNSDTKNSTSLSDSNSLYAKHIVEPYVLIEEKNIKMDNVREIVKSNFTNTSTTDSASSCSNDLRRDKHLISEPPVVSSQSITRDSPPPIPPSSYRNQPITSPPQSNIYAAEPHDNLKSSELTERLYMQTTLTPTSPSINNSLFRQESTDSHCSDSTNYSQCTAINTRDLDVTSPISDNGTWKNASTGNYSDSFVDSSNNDFNKDTGDANIKKLRLLCTETLASMPYGEEVLEELATVAQNIGEIRATKNVQSNEAVTIMPYPIPDLPHINDLQLSLDDDTHRQHTGAVHTIAIKHLPYSQSNENKLCSPSPPPVPSPPSKYDESWLGLPIGSNPNLFVCLSPSQRSYINDQSQRTSDYNNPDQLLDAHQKFIERRGYHEYSSDQIKAINAEKLEEQQILKTAAIMKKLRKSLTPPPPIPPPPVPSKSSETAAKAHSHTKRASDNDVSLRNADEQQITAMPEATTKIIVAAEAPFTDGEEENGRRLISIIHDSNEYKQNFTPPKRSSFENISRQASQNQQDQPTMIVSHSTAAIQTCSDQLKLVDIPKERIIKISTTSEVSAGPEKENMKSVESVIGKMFPTMGSRNIFDTSQKRFSNIETSSNTPYCSQISNTESKRYSNIETHSYESKKRVENGKVVLDYTNSKHERQNDGDKSSNSSIAHQSNAEAPQPYPMNESKIKEFIVKNENKETKIKANQPPNSEEIMSALKLNINDSKITSTEAAAKAAVATESKTATSTHSEQQQLNDGTNAKLSETKEETRRREYFKNRQQNEENKDIKSAYEEFRQRAKAAAELTESAPPLATAPATFSDDKHSKSSFHFDHEKLFKDFDDLSQQLHNELETGKQQREQREKSASLYDLSRVQMQFRDQFANLKKERHEHMKELEHEIERSMRSRQLKSFARQEFLNEQQQQQPRTYEIPIKIENGSTDTYKHNDRPDKGTYNNFNERGYKVTTPATPVTPYNYEYDENSHCRRAESMFNLSENTSSQSLRPRTFSTSKPFHVGNPGDWSRYASDLGSSENITKPFAREVEICYQRQRPRTIRAPRLSASANDLTVNSPTYDSYNAYNVRRTNAPMLNQAPQCSRPQYLSCHSMIERDPNPTYISTTSRRGVSPAPALVSAGAPPPPPISLMHCSSQESYDREFNKRRASLPREIHEQQLKYISSKEEDLKNEIDRLQNERRRLLNELNQPQIPVVQPPMRSMRDVYRPIPKLPTLSEDEVFRQQMAEEWLNKVAEREERRLKKIIKISKANEHEACQIPIHHTTFIKQDIGEEFLNRVKERRSKLAMPADSDWESGAESQPVVQGEYMSETEEVPKIKVIEGKSEADLRQLPRHLREFAKFSNHQCENIEGGQREVHQEEEHCQEANNNCINSAIKKSSVVKTIKISRPSDDQNVFSVNSATTTGPTGMAYADTDPLSTTTPMAFNPPPPIPKSPFLTKLPAITFGEMFSTSPFKNRIFEEFDHFWRSFENNNNNNNK